MATARFTPAARRKPPAFRSSKSTMSICSIEDIAGAVDKPFWFQLYVMKDRGFIKSLIERAIAAKCSALVLTVDTQVIGQRHADIKNGMTVPPEWSLAKLFDFASKARLGCRRAAWQAPHLRQSRRSHQDQRRHQHARDLDQFAIRHVVKLEGYRMGPRHLAGQAGCSRAFSDVEDRRGGAPRPGRRRWWCPTMAAASSTAAPFVDRSVA